MKLLMEHWRDYQRENDFGILCEDFKRGSIKQDELMLIWERQVNKQLDPLLEEISLLEEGLLDMGKEAFAKLAAKAKEAWAEKVSAFYEKAKLFIVKTVNQAITITKNFLSKIPDTLKKIEINSYFTILNGIKKLMMGAARVSKYVGRFAIIALGALVVIIALSSVAHAAGAGVEPDAQIFNVAAEMIMQAWEAAGGLETTGIEDITLQMDHESINGEIIRDVVSVDALGFKESQNQLVDALQLALDSAKESTLGRSPQERFDALRRFNFDHVGEIVEKYVTDATELRETDPELFAEYSRLADNIRGDSFWDIESVLTDIQQNIRGGTTVDGATVNLDRTAFDATSHQRGVDFFRRGQ